MTPRTCPPMFRVVLPIRTERSPAANGAQLLLGLSVQCAAVNTQVRLTKCGVHECDRVHGVQLMHGQGAGDGKESDRDPVVPARSLKRVRFPRNPKPVTID